MMQTEFESDAGGELRFMQVDNEEALTFCKTVLMEDQKRSMATLFGMSSNGVPFWIDRVMREGRSPELYSLMRVAPAADDQVQIRLLSVGVVERSLSTPVCNLLVTVPARERRNGYGRLMLHALLYRLFTVSDTKTILSKVSRMNEPARSLASGLFGLVGSVPHSWLWYGNWVPTDLYAITSEDFLYRSYDTVAQSLRLSSVDGVDVVPYEEFAATRLRS